MARNRRSQYEVYENIRQSDVEAIKLYDELKECLFPKSGTGGGRKPAIPGPTEDLELFGKAMSIVATLGDIGRKERILSGMRKKIEDHDVMKNDFPFYISLIGYISLNWPSIEGSELKDLVIVCKLKFEAMKVHKDIKAVHSSLKNFLSRSDSHQIRENDPPTLLVHGCVIMTEDFDMYSSILYVSIAIIVKHVNLKGRLFGEDTDGLWKEHFVERSKQIQFSEGDLRKVKNGLKFMIYIEELVSGDSSSLFYLSQAYTESTHFSLTCASKLISMIIGSYGISYARMVSNYIRIGIQQEMESHSTIPFEVVENGIKVFQLFDRELVSSQEKLSEVCHQGGIDDQKEIISEVSGWIKVLLAGLLRKKNFDLIDKVLEESERCLYMRQNKAEKFRETVDAMMKREALPIKSFYRLYQNNRNMWENELVLKFVKSYPSHKFECDLKDENWVNFLKDLAKQFTDVKYEECVLHFFEKCLSCAVEKETFLMDSLKLMIKDSFFAENLKNTEMFIEFFSNLVEDIQVLDLPLKKVLKYTAKSKNEVSDHVLLKLQKKLASECKTGLFQDDRVKQCLKTVSEEFAGHLIGKKRTFCWDIVDTVYSDIPEFNSNKFSVAKYEEILWSTKAVRLKFKEWYSIDAHYILAVTTRKSHENGHCFTWVTECLKEIMNQKRFLEDGSANYCQMISVLKSFPDMNKLLGLLLPDTEARKFRFDRRRIDEVIFEYQSVQASIINLMFRTTPAGGDVKLTGNLYSLMVNYGVKFSTSLLEETEACLTGHISDMSASSRHFKKTVTLNALKKLKESITRFVSPITRNMNFFVFFSLHDSILFKSHLKAHLQGREAASVEDLNVGLSETKKLLTSFVNGDIKYNILTLDGKIAFNKMDIVDREFAIFTTALEFQLLTKEPDSIGYQVVKVLIELFEVANNVLVLLEVFDRFKLNMILEQPEFVELYQFASRFVENHSKIDIKLHEAEDVLKELQTKLYLKGSEECRCLEMLTTIRDSRELFLFILSKKFYGENDTFRNSFQFITTQLQSMDYDENVLNNLPAAVRLLAPFCSVKDSHGINPFKDIMESLRKNSKLEIEKVKIVNQHMSIIQRWFSTSNDRNLLLQLSDVIRSGSFNFGADQKKSPITLSYISSGDSSRTILQPEEVNDFSRAIRFYEGKEGEESIKIFKHSFEATHQLWAIMQKANEVGCGLDLTSVSCSMPVTDLNELVDAALSRVKEFTKKVTYYQQEHPWLLLISTPKILLLSDILSQHKPSPVFNIMCEIIHITNAKWEDIESEIERAVVDSSWQCKEDPVQQVGKFLKYTSKLYEYQPLTQTKTMKHLKLKLAISKSQLIDIIYEVYGTKKASLKPHLLLICGPTTSENALEVMFKRAKKFIDIYMIIGINLLSFKLQEALMKLVKEYHSYCECNSGSVIHLVETRPSYLRDVSWMCEFTAVRESDESKDGFAEYFGNHCRKSLSLECIFIHSQPGDGKTYYIHKLKKKEKLSVFHTITIDESFSIEQVIYDLRQLYDLYDKQVKDIGIFFNFTVFKTKGKVELWDSLNWFFFHLLVVGYVEDEKTGRSFALLRGISWKIYIEAPSSSDNIIRNIYDAIPILEYVCESFSIGNLDDYEIDDNVQLVCKYLQAHSSNKLNPEVRKKWRQRYFSGSKLGLTKISEKDDIPVEQCYEIISEYTPKEDYPSKYSKKLFIQYLHKRCKFLDDSEGITNRHQLMDIMLSEVTAFTSCSACESWSSTIKYQVVYKRVEEDKAIVLMCTNVDEVTERISTSAKDCSVLVPKESEVHGIGYLTRCLSRAFDIKVKDCVTCLQEMNYVLTPDFAMKMININECKECRSPLIISGETGVGKSFLIEAVSKLWNLSAVGSIKELKSSLLKSIEEKGLVAEQKEWEKIRTQFFFDGFVRKDYLLVAIKKSEVSALSQVVEEELKNNPHIWMLLDLPIEGLQEETAVGEDNVVEIICSILTTTKARTTFFKLFVHSAQTSDDIDNFFKKPIELCQLFLEFSGKKSSAKVPSVTVFIDELNTSSCGGCLKEIIADRTFHGKPLPENLFVIAACNPHRGNSIILNTDFNEVTWARGTYYVKELHPTLKFMMWDFGALTTTEERNYVDLKVKNTLSDGSKEIEKNFHIIVELIIQSQQLMREYAENFISKNSVKISPSDAKDCAKSCVSQRDIQRVFVFFSWLTRVYKKYRHGLKELEHRAILVSIGLVYFLRLDSNYRRRYAEKIKSFKEMKFLDVFDRDVDWFISHLHFPDRIAQTKTLKQNLFATIVCTCTKTPLILVGKPGTSKTLSFNIAVENLKGIDSDKDILKDTELFPSIDPQLYQCSRQTTSFEIDKLFRRAIKRQAAYSGEVNCVVFMDEAGLPEERHESLKILHHYLDEHKVAFVAISNHVLDAAKTNRAISVTIPENTEKDLHELVKGCYKDAIMTSEVVKYCPSFLEVAENEKWRKIFGMRDFIHFLHYIYQKGQQLTDELVLHALERNFNGTDDFGDVCEVFSLERIGRDVLEIVKESINDKCDLSKGYIRYKLIIDPSEDDSMISFLFKYGILERGKTRRFISSNLFGDKGLAKVDIISAVCHSITKGETVVMNQTEDIHECFYDLFNLRFRAIEDSDGQCNYFANVAIGGHIKPICVHPDFQCVIVLKQSKLMDTPSPFLNRFEKYKLSHEMLFKSILQNYPVGIRRAITGAFEKIESFIEVIEGARTLYGYREQTIYSLFLLMLTSKRTPLSLDIDESLFQENKQLFFHMTLLNALSIHGINIIQFYADMRDVEYDASALFELLLQADVFCKSFEELSTSQTNLQEYIDQAMDILVDSKQGLITTADNFIFSYMLQLIVRIMCKALLQVMTPEGVIKFRKNIPCSYLHSYLHHQNHFTLKDIIDQEVLETEDNVRLKKDQNLLKFIVYCRSSALFQCLPSVFPSLEAARDQEFLKSNVLSDLSSLSILNLSVITSQQVFTDKICQFLDHDSMKLLLLVVNMLESSPEAVNHLRVIIEESQSNTMDVSKSIIVLLHFPSSMFFNGIYPTLFLHGWKYRYINSLSSKAESSLIDIELWIKNCLDKNAPLKNFEDSFSKSLLHSVRSIIPLLIAEFKSNDYINSEQMSVVLSSEVARLLCDRFLEYFGIQLCIKYLEDVARAVFQHKSTINLKTQIEEKIKDNFFYFIKYILSSFHIHGVTAALMNPTCSDELHKYIYDLIPYVPVPDLVKLADEVPHFPQATLEGRCNYQLPFFLYAFEEIEALIESGIISATEAEQREHRSITKGEIFSSVMVNLQKKMQEYSTFGTRILALMENYDLLQKYMHDFVFKHLGIDIKQHSFVLHLMSTIKDSGTNRYTRKVEGLACDLLALHFQYQVHQKLINSSAGALRLLNGIDSHAAYDSRRWIELDIKAPVELLSKSNLKVICQYVLMTLYKALDFSARDCTSKLDTFDSWNELYSTMMSDDKYTSEMYKIFKRDFVSSEEAEWNLMHCMHACSILLSTKRDGRLEVHNTRFVFQNAGFEELHLECIHEKILELQEQRKIRLTANILYDRLFAHFLSTFRSEYSYNDLHCFLKIVSNERHHVSQSVLAYYLKRTLKSHFDEATTLKVNSQVRREIGYAIDKNLHRPAETHGMENLQKAILKECPLARLYFLLIKEELLSRSSTTTDLIDHIEECEKEIRSNGVDIEKILLSMEIEALTQVSMKTVVNEFSSSGRDEVIYILKQQMPQTYTSVLKSFLLNRGEKYDAILIKHMLEQSKSLEILHQNYAALCVGLEIPNKFKKREEKPANMFSIYISLFFEPSHSGNGVSYFSNVCSTIDDLYSDKVTDMEFLHIKLKELFDTSQKMKHIVISGISLFYMSIWLAIFQELFEKDRNFPRLCESLKSYLPLDCNAVLLFECLLNTTDINPEMESLFHLLKSGGSSISMRRSMAVVIAGILGCDPPCFFYTQLFEPMKLKNTYIPGFMSDQCLTEDFTYCMGTTVTSDGLYKNYSQYRSARERGLLLQNAYIFSWINFSSILMSLLSRQVSYQELSEVEVILGCNSRDFLENQLHVVWKSMQRHYSLLHEELEHLIVEVMQRLVKSCKSGSEVFTSQKDRDAYEKKVVADAIVPALSSLGDKSPFESDELFQVARLLEDDDFLSLEVADLGYIAATQQIDFLSEYLFAKEALEVVAKNLPILVELYEFIHRELSYKLTKDTAKELTIHGMLTKIKKYQLFSPEDIKNLKEMIDTYFKCSRDFVKFTGIHGCRKLLLNENSTVISLMSADEDDGDCLYRIIVSMVDYHNTVIKNLCDLGGISVHDSSLCGISYTKPLAEPIALVERCSLARCQRRRDNLFTIQCTKDMINKEQIVLDLIEGYLKVKSIITVNNFRRGLKFNSFFASTSLEDEFKAKIHGLPSSLLTNLPEDLAKKFNHNFCSSSLSELRSTVLGLLAIIGSLHKHVAEITALDRVRVIHYVRSFLLKDQQTDVLTPKSNCIDKLIRVELSKEQLSCLEEMPVEMLVSAVRLFCDWIKDGLYDFNEIDFIFKVPLSSEAEEELKQLPFYKEEHISGDTIKSLLELETLIAKMQPDIMQKRSEHKMSLVSQLQSNSQLIPLVPKSIRLENYVYFRIKVKKLIALTEETLALRNGGALESSDRTWNEMIHDSPWMGLHRIKDNEPVIVHEEYMSDIEEETPYSQLDTAISESEPEPDTFSEPSVATILEHVPDLSAIEDDDDDDIPSAYGFYKKPLTDYTEEDLIEYLKENDMENFIDIIEEDTNGETISDWDFVDFEEAGVSNPSDQVKLYLLFSRLKPPTKISKFSTPLILQFLESSESEPTFKKYVKVFKELQINGNVLLKCKPSFLQRIGVESVLDATKIIVLFRKYTGEDYDHEASQQSLISAINDTDLKTKEKEEYVRIMENFELSFSILQNGGVELLKELGVSQQKSRKLFKKLNIN